MVVSRLLMVCVLLSSPSVSFAAAAGGGADNKDKGDEVNFVDLPPHRAPALDDILDSARERLEEKSKRDRLRQRVLKSESERKQKIEKRLENHLEKDLPADVQESRNPGILEPDISSSKNVRPESEKNSKFIPITTGDLKSAFSKVGGESLELHRDGNDLVIDLLCEEKNKPVLVKSLLKEKTSEAHINEARSRFCSD